MGANEKETAQSKAAEAAAAKKSADKEASDAFAQRWNRKEAEKRNATEGLLTVSKLKAFCKTFDLQVEGNTSIDEIMTLLQKYLDETDPALIAKRREEIETPKMPVKDANHQVDPATTAESEGCESPKTLEETTALKMSGEDVKQLSNPAMAPKTVEETASQNMREEGVKQQDNPSLTAKTPEERTGQKMTVEDVKYQNSKQTAAERDLHAVPDDASAVAKKTEDVAMPQKAEEKVQRDHSEKMSCPAAEPKGFTYEVAYPHGTPIRSGSAESLAIGAAKYEGRLNQGATLRRIDDQVYASHHGIAHGLFKVVSGSDKGLPASGSSTFVFVSMTEVAVASKQ